jgi:hypothetical protein
MKGTKFNRLLFQLQPKTHRIEETDAGLSELEIYPTPNARDWKDTIGNGKDAPSIGVTRGYSLGQKLNSMLPTPTVMDSTNATATMKSTQVKEGSMHSVTLTRALSMGMLPTPNTCYAKTANNKDNHDVKKGYLRGFASMGMLPTPNAAEGYKSAKTYNPKSQMGSSLSAMAGSSMLPTPTVADSKHSTTKSDSWDKRIEQKHLAETVLNPFVENKGGKTSQLNPRFVAEMMGFPHNWTELPFQSGEQNPSKDMEMP